MNKFKVIHFKGKLIRYKPSEISNIIEINVPEIPFDTFEYNEIETSFSRQITPKETSNNIYSRFISDSFHYPENYSKVYENSYKLILLIVKRIFNDIRINHTVDESLINKSLLTSLIVCLNELNCKNFTNSSKKFNELEVGILTDILNNNLNDLKEITLIQKEKWVLNNYLQKPKLTVYLKSNVEYASLLVGLLCTMITVMFIYIFSLKKIINEF